MGAQGLVSQHRSRAQHIINKWDDVIGADSPGIPIRNTEEKTFLPGSKSRIFFYNNALRLYGLKR
jgi:hypothetical protein